MDSGDLVSRRALKAFLNKGDPDAAADGAAEIGCLVAEVRGLHGRVNLLIALVLLVLGVLVQIALRLPSPS